MSDYYPPVSFYFTLAFQGISGADDAAFMEASGMDAEFTVTEIKEGGENRFTHRVPERAKYGNLVLKRGMVTASSSLATWCRRILESDLSGQITPRSVQLSLLDHNANPLMTWNFVNAWPVKWSVASFNAQENKLAMETLEFSYNYFTRRTGGS
ncbi:MAG: phage tail protein [Pseudomonadota bacterium]|jgi:phage tail-like protein|uniref:phage tail protein n=1 Tax=Burkholderiaceae TaxID=119060 RepID=UPI0010F4C88F|nr:phage tail protein [Burkholderia sp. 4M9327F10]